MAVSPYRIRLIVTTAIAAMLLAALAMAAPSPAERLISPGSIPCPNCSIKPD